MRLWTFIVDFMGGTYVSQCVAEEVDAALEWFAIEQPLKSFFRFESDESFFEPVVVNETQSVWLTTVLDVDHEELILLHIVETVLTHQPEPEAPSV